jgi:hypothetical protein
VTSVRDGRCGVNLARTIFIGKSIHIRELVEPRTISLSELSTIVVGKTNSVNYLIVGMALTVSIIVTRNT